MKGTEDIAEMVERLLKEACKERGHINVLIAGRSGVGKSTLINALFQGDFAATGQGRPVTACTREITKEGIPLTIFDTRGLEMKAFRETLTELENLVSTRNRDTDHKRHIHVAWLCIQEGGSRVESAEIDLHNMLSKHMPVIGVITKAKNDNGFKNEVQKLLPQARNIIRIRAIPEQFDDGHIMPPMGLEELVQLTSEVIPEAIRNAFSAAQKASIQNKKDSANKIVVAAAATAVAAGASPIPFSDAAILVPIQIGMLAKISAVFGLTLSKAFLMTLVASVAGAGGAAYVGRTIVGNLIKFVPGIGIIVGGVISGATAGLLTTALGEIYIAVLVKLFCKTGGEAPSEDDIINEFKAKLKL